MQYSQLDALLFEATRVILCRVERADMVSSFFGAQPLLALVAVVRQWDAGVYRFGALSNLLSSISTVGAFYSDFGNRGGIAMAVDIL